MMLNTILLILAFYLPPSTTKGSLNPNVTQDNIQQTVCVSGWTKEIRPSSSYTTKLKIQQMKEMGLSGDPKDYEEDHLISLEIGGNPTDPANLWPQPWAGPYGAHQKDRLENALHKDVCSGKISLKEAQKVISEDWVKEYKKRFEK